MEGKLFCFGMGYTAIAAAAIARERGYMIAGTVRNKDAAAHLIQLGVDVRWFERGRPLDQPGKALAGVTHIITSIRPDEAGDPVLDHHGADLQAIASLRRVAYLSTTAVYGDSGGAWLDETAPLAPVLTRAHQRVRAENGWRALTGAGLPAQIYRLDGIYGPGRSNFDRLRDGTARRLVKEGQVFGRIHVEDAARAIWWGMDRAEPGAVFNVCDDEPAPPQDVVAYAAQLAGMTPPPEVPYAPELLSPMARSFYSANRRMRAAALKALGWTPRYPTYREGLAAIHAEEPQG